MYLNLMTLLRLAPLFPAHTPVRACRHSHHLQLRHLRLRGAHVSACRPNICELVLPVQMRAARTSLRFKSMQGRACTTIASHAAACMHAAVARAARALTQIHYSRAALSASTARMRRWEVLHCGRRPYPEITPEQIPTAVIAGARPVFIGNHMPPPFRFVGAPHRPACIW